MSRTRWKVPAVAFVLSLVAVGCDADADVAAPGTGDVAAGAPATVAVTLTDFAIDPSMPEVAPGAPLTFDVSNEGQAPHTFGVVVGDETIETATIDPGSSASLDVPALEAGEYEILCTVPGHADLGMTGMLHVGDAGGATAAPSHATMTAEEMAAGHEEGVVAFAGQLEDGPLTAEHGGQPIDPTMDGRVKIFSLTTTEVSWEVAPGEFVDAMAFNGQVPGPRSASGPATASASSSRTRCHSRSCCTSTASRCPTRWTACRT